MREKGSNHSFVHSATVQPQEWRFGMALGRLHWWTADCQGAETANTTRTRLISNGRLPGEGSKEELLVPCHYYWNDTEETWHCSFPFPSVKSVPLKKKIAPFQEDFCRKGTQRTQREEVMTFLLCDLCVLLRPVHFWVAPSRLCAGVIKKQEGREGNGTKTEDRIMAGQNHKSELDKFHQLIYDSVPP